MAALTDLAPSDLELENLWRTFHCTWVAASEELARAEASLLAESDPRLRAAAQQVVDALRRHERHARTTLEQFEGRVHQFRSRAAAYRLRYV